jgi:Zn-dependent peptidase ImmA (M78 family)
MSQRQVRRRLSREQIDEKAEEVLRFFRPDVFQLSNSPLYSVVEGLLANSWVRFGFNVDLGFSSSGRKILGQFDFEPRTIQIDKILPNDSPRFRWTLAHEIGHLVLHRKLDRSLITVSPPVFIDTREHLQYLRTAERSELEWVEWQANQFAAALLLPRPIVYQSLVAVQREQDIPRAGTIFVDDQVHNRIACEVTLRTMSERLNVSRSVLRYRLLHLGLLVDARRSERDHIQHTVRALLCEE